LGFSADWLALREPADMQARDHELMLEAVRLAGENPVILDLGSGTGSTIRAMAPYLPEHTQWRLVDNDSGLLEIAKSFAPDVAVFCQDLTELAALPLDGVTLVTGSALLDLVSPDWLSSLISRISTPAYFALSYDGEMQFEPGNPLDDAVRSAFNSHQRGDKGFGPALGPDAPKIAESLFEKAGFSVSMAPSNWELDAESMQLEAELMDGIANAALEAGVLQSGAWLQDRTKLLAVSKITIGHQDLLAVPSGSGAGA
jgi:SAM-dependent methyltransferase